MTQSKCPDGHDSDWDDYCSVCGTAIAAGASAPAAESTAPAAESTAPAAGTSAPAGVAAPTQSETGAAAQRCSNCGAAHRPEDVFCESCGLDFVTGTLPQSPAGSGSDPGPGANPGPPGQVRIGADSAWFDQAVGGGELTFPAPAPETVTIPLPGHKALVGRQSQSRGVFPEVDLAKLTGDPAVSTRHALIERNGQDEWTITDVGSTNGTRVGADLASAVELQPGVAVPFGPGSSAWLGAWTRIDFGS